MKPARSTLSALAATSAIAALFYAGPSVRGDALDNWTPSQIITNLGGSYYGMLLSGLTYGNGRYVAVGEYVSNDNGIIQTSEDGMNWTRRSALDYSVLDLYDVAFGNGIFVAVGWDWFGGQNIYHSTNGINWTPHTTSIGNLYGVAYGGGLFVSVGDGVLVGSSSTTNRNIYTSPNGVNWTARSSGSPTGDVRPIRAVAYGAGRFVAVGEGSLMYASTTGSTWTRTTNSGAGNSVSFCNGLFIVPAGAGTNLVSTDGLNWSLLANNTAAAFGRVGYASGTYVALAGSTAFTSTDGTNWMQRTVPPATNIQLEAIAYASGRFVIVGYTNPNPPALTGFLPVGYISDPIAALSINPGLPPQLAVSGLVGRSYRIEYQSDLRSNNWQALATFTLSNSPSVWADTQATNSSRFYRAALLP